MRNEMNVNEENILQKNSSVSDWLWVKTDGVRFLVGRGVFFLPSPVDQLSGQSSISSDSKATAA